MDNLISKINNLAASENSANPLISVVIPCYNHAHYLPEAIESLRQQSFQDFEIIVVDDGSSDNTREVALEYPEVRYVYKENGGLSSARNTGIKESKGDFLVFLDADDWLFRRGLEINVGYLQQNQDLAFVSGAFDAAHVNENITKEYVREVNKDHYCRLLEGNYIGMVAAVMFRRRVFDEVLFDTSLKSCEDYDLYLEIARKYPVFHHTSKIAVYRIHSSNMSANIPRMLNIALEVLGRQKNKLKTAAEKEAYRKGRAWWKEYYGQLLYDKLVWNHLPHSGEAAITLLKNRPAFYFSYIRIKTPKMIKSKIKSFVPDSLKTLLRKGAPANGKASVKPVSMGDMDSLSPFSKYFGYDRGGAIDRYYVENFLQKEAGSIKGRVLEIGDNAYTMSYGKEQVKQSDILHVDERNPDATLYGDISDAPHIPDNTFDCIVLTQTLHLIYNFKEALHTCYRILKPGGTLLLTVPGITPIDHDEWKETWYWSFTDKAMKMLMKETFPAGNIEVNAFGNVNVAAAFLYGMGLPEVSKEKLDHHDEHFQVIVTVKAVKR